MQIIFESVEEQYDFMREVCPSRCGGNEPPTIKCRPGLDDCCIKCWEKSGVQYSVKNQPTPYYPIPIEMQEGCETTIITKDPLKPGDKLVCKNGVWGIERQSEPMVFISTGRRCGRTEMVRRAMLEYLKPKD